MIELPFLELKIYEIVAFVQVSAYNFTPSIRTLVCIILEHMFVFLRDEISGNKKSYRI